MPVLAVTPDVIRQGREALDSAFGTQPTMGVRYGPPQPPLDELQGDTFTPDMVGDMGNDPFGDDDFTVDQRVQASRYLLAAYDANRARPVYPPVWFTPGLYVLSGDVGDGKTLTAVSVAVIFMMCGWPAYSANGGLLFGKMLKPAQVYAFPEFLSRGSICVADELHAIYGNYEGQTVRGRTMAQGTAAFRKERIYAFGATAREHLLGNDLKAAVRGVGYPFTTYPKGMPIAPPWACRGIRWYYPDPWRGRQYRELHDKAENHRQPCERYVAELHAYDLYTAAKHYNSWEKITLDYGGKLGAGAFRAAISGNGDADGGDESPQRRSRSGSTDEAIGLRVLTWYEDGYFSSEVEAYNNALGEGRSTARGNMLITIDSLASRLTSETGLKVGAPRIRRGLAAAGVKHSTRYVNVEALEEAFQDRKQTFAETFGSGEGESGVG